MLRPPIIALPDCQIGTSHPRSHNSRQQFAVVRCQIACLHPSGRGEALSVVHRARSAFAEIGLEPPRPLLDLERSIVA